MFENRFPEELKSILKELVPPPINLIKKIEILGYSVESLRSKL